MTSPRVAPGLLSWPAWQALRSADVVLVPAGHPQLPALDEADVGYRVVDESDVESLALDGVVVWLPEPGAELVIPPGARLLPGSADLPGARFLDLVATMDRLRVECPWDAGQSHGSLAPHLLEEPYEALEALESGDEQAFCEELGDVLLQVVFHARIAAERDDGTSFTVDDVADGIVTKLVRSPVPRTSSAIGTRSSGKRRKSGPNEPGYLRPRPARRPRLTECRSASLPWPWPRSCNAGRRGPAYPTNWRASRAITGRLIPVRISVASCSVWLCRLVRRDVIPRWSYAPPRAAIVTSCAPGSVHKSANSFSLAPSLVPSGIAAGYRRVASVTVSHKLTPGARLRGLHPFLRVKFV